MFVARFHRKRSAVKLFLLVFFSILFASAGFLSPWTQEKPAARDTYDWKKYEDSSTVPLDSINKFALRGNWVKIKFVVYGDFETAYRASEGSMGSLEFKEEKYRNSLAGQFYDFTLDRNQMRIFDDAAGQTAYINKLSDKELIISTKEGKDFIRTIYHR